MCFDHSRTRREPTIHTNSVTKRSRYVNQNFECTEPLCGDNLQTADTGHITYNSGAGALLGTKEVTDVACDPLYIILLY